MAAAVVGDRGEDSMTAIPEQFAIHREPAWRGRADFVVNASLPEPGRYEQLWCRQVSDDTFEVCCIPFFLYDVALGDVVQTVGEDGRRYVVNRVIRASGRYVFRAHFDKSMMPNRDEIVDRLSALGAIMEFSSESLIAVDARDEPHSQQIAGFLIERENLGQLLYETGRTS